MTVQGEDDQGDNPQANGPEGASASGGSASRRQLLRLGAAGTVAVLSVRPALAQTTASVMNCTIPVPGPGDTGKAVALDGSLVQPGSPNSYAGGRLFKGEDVRNALRGRSLPGTSYSESQAYLNYIRRLQYGRSGFTCYASLQMPR